MKNELKFFENSQIRTAWDEEKIRTELLKLLSD